MAKKFVRGITDVKTITKQDFDTNNVNDLLSDGEHNYIHRKKKDNSEEYHNLTNNIKTITSDNTDLLSVTNYNNTNNTAKLSPKHDKQKEQVLDSERQTITINHAENGTSDKTKVDTNPQKVLEHDNLTYNTPYVTVDHVSGEETTLINSEKVSEKFNVIDSALKNKQGKLTAGDNITIKDNVISSTGGSSTGGSSITPKIIPIESSGTAVVYTLSSETSIYDFINLKILPGSGKIVIMTTSELYNYLEELDYGTMGIINSGNVTIEKSGLDAYTITNKATTLSHAQFIAEAPSIFW